MYNEILFFTQIGIVSIFALGALLFGRAGLFAFVSTSWVIANLFIPKEVYLFGLAVITADVFTVGCDVGITLLREYYGKEDAKKAIYIGLYLLLFFLTVSQFLVWYQPTTTDTSHIHFANIFGRMPRIILTSFFVALLTKNLTLIFFNTLTNLWGEKYFQIKTMLSIGASQFIDTSIFSFIALYGTVSSIMSVIGFSYAVKVLAISICVPLITTLHHYIRKPRGI